MIQPYASAQISGCSEDAIRPGSWQTQTQQNSLRQQIGGTDKKIHVTPQTNNHITDTYLQRCGDRREETRRGQGGAGCCLCGLGRCVSTADIHVQDKRGQSIHLVPPAASTSRTSFSNWAVPAAVSGYFLRPPTRLAMEAFWTGKSRRPFSSSCSATLRFPVIMGCMDIYVYISGGLGGSV